MGRERKGKFINWLPQTSRGGVLHNSGAGAIVNADKIRSTLVTQLARESIVDSDINNLVNSTNTYFIKKPEILTPTDGQVLTGNDKILLVPPILGNYVTGQHIATHWRILNSSSNSLANSIYNEVVYGEGLVSLPLPEGLSPNTDYWVVAKIHIASKENEFDNWLPSEWSNIVRFRIDNNATLQPIPDIEELIPYENADHINRFRFKENNKETYAAGSTYKVLKVRAEITSNEMSRPNNSNVILINKTITNYGVDLTFPEYGNTDPVETELARRILEKENTARWKGIFTFWYEDLSGNKGLPITKKAQLVYKEPKLLNPFPYALKVAKNTTSMATLIGSGADKIGHGSNADRSRNIMLIRYDYTTANGGITRFWMYDKVRNTWLWRGSHPETNYYTNMHNIAFINSEEVLIAGGCKDNTSLANPTVSNVLNTTYVFNVRINTWTQKANLPTRLFSSNSVITKNGDIYIVGLDRNNSYRLMIIHYDLATDTHTVVYTETNTTPNVQVYNVLPFKNGFIYSLTKKYAGNSDLRTHFYYVDITGTSYNATYTLLNSLNDPTQRRHRYPLAPAPGGGFLMYGYLRSALPNQASGAANVDQMSSQGKLFMLTEDRSASSQLSIKPILMVPGATKKPTNLLNNYPMAPINGFLEPYDNYGGYILAGGLSYSNLETGGVGKNLSKSPELWLVYL